jgi:hypothetical protein
MDQRDTFEQFESLALPKLDAAVRLPHPVCTENLNAGVVVMESAQDGA